MQVSGEFNVRIPLKFPTATNLHSTFTEIIKILKIKQGNGALCDYKRILLHHVIKRVKAGNEIEKVRVILRRGNVN